MAKAAAPLWGRKKRYSGRTTDRHAKALKSEGAVRRRDVPKRIVKSHARTASILATAGLKREKTRWFTEQANGTATTRSIT